MTFKVLVTGGRDYKNKKYVFKVLSIFHKELNFTKIVEGGATGADTFAKEWAKENNIDWQEYKADWDQYGKAAGGIRNRYQYNTEKPNLVIAFPGGSGTADQVLVAKEDNCKIIDLRHIE